MRVYRLTLAIAHASAFRRSPHVSNDAYGSSVTQAPPGVADTTIGNIKGFRPPGRWPVMWEVRAR